MENILLGIIIQIESRGPTVIGNMRINGLTGTLKYIYLKGQRVQRLDKLITAIMKLVRYKLYERLIISHKGIL